MQGGAHAHATRGQERRRLIELTEVWITTAHVHTDVSEIAGIHRQSELTGEADVIDHVRESNVVDPQFERVVAHDARPATRHTVHAHQADGHLLHTGQIGRRDRGIGAVHDIAILTDGVATHSDTTRHTRSTNQLKVGTGTGHRVGRSLQKVVLELCTQNLELLQIDAYFGLPRAESHAGIDRGAIHVKVVLVPADLDIPIQLAVLAPAVAATTHPQPERLVTHEGLGAFLKPEERFSPIERTELTARNARLQSQRALIHLETIVLVAGLSILRCFDHAWRRRVRHQ